MFIHRATDTFITMDTMNVFRRDLLSSASLDLDFARNYAAVNGVVGVPSDFLTTTRASDAYADNSAGVWSLFGSGVPRITNKGLLVEESRTNSNRNSACAGALAGTPGTLPTNFSNSLGGTSSREIIGFGTEDGIDYFDIKITANTVGDSWNIIFESATVIDAVNGQTWTGSFFVKYIDGDTTVFNLSSAVVFRGAGGALLTTSSTSFTPTTSWQRPSKAFTATDASTAKVTNQIGSGAASKTGYITLRIGWPQLELDAFATSPIRTTNAAATRAADAITTALAGTSEGAVVIHARTAPGVGTTNQVLLCHDDGTNQNRWIIYRRSADRKILCEVSVGGVNQATLVLDAVADDTAFKVGLSWKAADFVAVLNGGVAQTAGSGSVPSGLTTLRHGASSGGLQWNGRILRESILGAYQSAAQLQSVTAP